jgi:hypothetical protein
MDSLHCRTKASLRQSGFPREESNGLMIIHAIGPRGTGLSFSRVKINLQKLNLAKSAVAPQ